MVFQLYIKRGKATIKPYNKASWRGIVQIFFKKISKYKKVKATIKPYKKASWRGIVQIFFKKISKLLEASKKLDRKSVV